MSNKVPPLIDPSLSLKGETARKCLIFLNQISGWSSSDVGESYGEGFPNVVAESMACGTPSVVTDVGDSSLIVGSTGWVVPPNDSIKLANAIKKAINERGTVKWNKRCNKARLRIKENYSISKMINLYNKVWSSVYTKKNKI